MSTIKIAGVQMDIQLADRDANLAAMKTRLQQTVEHGAQLTVFPECTTTGYCFESLDEALRVAESIDGPTSAVVGQWCEELSTQVIYGFLESDQGTLFNSLALIGPTGVLASYRKVHLPTLGVDRFTTSGAGFSVVDTGNLRIGMNICYDCSFPESARVMTLQGADLIALPSALLPIFCHLTE